MRRAAAARLAKPRPLLLVTLLLLLVGCAPRSKNTVLLREGVDARLVTRVNQGLFLTTVRIGDREAGPFLIDTGADRIYLDSELAKSLNLSFWAETIHSETKQKFKWGTVPSIEVGPLTFQNTDVAVVDLSVVTPMLGERVAGLLGHPFFAQAVVEIDYPTGAIACFDPKTYRLPQGGWAPLTIQRGRPVIAARVDGNLEGQFLLDTGSNSAVLFHADFIQKHALLDHRVTSRRTMVRADGRYEALTGKLGWFEFAGHRFEQPIVDFDLSNTPASLPSGIAGTIGRGFLRRFTVVFNYPESRIAFLLKPTHATAYRDRSAAYRDKKDHSPEKDHIWRLSRSGPIDRGSAASGTG
jgi:predicted aspartyl protease